MKYLILGVGEVGTCLACELINSKNNCVIHIHTLTKSSMENKLKKLRSIIKTNSNNKVSGSYGDIYLTKKHLNNQNFLNNIDTSDIDYLYSNIENWYEDSLIYELLKIVEPDYIIDTVTLAVKFRNNFIYDLYNNKNDKDLIDKILFYNPTTVLSNYVQSVKYALKNFCVSGYIKVSSSGLGGMGFNCPYTHGSINSIKLNPSIELKIASLGIMHQLLWNLFDSEKVKVSLIVPKALIGWDKPLKITNNKKNIYNFKNNNKTINKDKLLKFSISCIPCGDSTYYSIQEYIVASSVGQFESISKEEVVKAVIDSIQGSDRYNILNYISNSSINSSYYAFSKREQVILEAKKIENSLKTPSLVTGNFGPYISKLISELYVIVCALSNKKILDNFSLSNCSELCYKYLKNNPKIKDQILSANPVIETNVGSWFLYEDYSHNEIIDLTDKNILLWKNFLANLSLIDQKKHYILENIGELISKYLSENGFVR